jgi:hypothetical protein
LLQKPLQYTHFPLSAANIFPTLQRELGSFNQSIETINTVIYTNGIAAKTIFPVKAVNDLLH